MDLKTCFSGGAEESIHFMIFFAELLKNDPMISLKAPFTPQYYHYLTPLTFNYFRLYGPRCGGCGDGISPSDLVRRARDKVYHVKCFSCQVLVFAVCAKMFAKRGVWY